MKTSILIANYNTSQLTINCVESILKYCDFSRGDKEVIIIDDCSNEEQYKKLCRWLAGDYDNVTPHLQELPEAIKLIRNNENKGIGATMNEGLKVAKGDYIIRVDNDTLFCMKDFDDRLVKFLLEDPELGLLSCKTDNIMQPVQQMKIPEVFTTDEQVIEFINNMGIAEIEYFSTPNHAFAGFCLAFRKSEVGDFDTSSKIYGEDNLKYMDYVKKGMKCGVAQRLFIRHLYHGTQKVMNQDVVNESRQIAQEEFRKRWES